MVSSSENPLYVTGDKCSHDAAMRVHLGKPLPCVPAQACHKRLCCFVMPSHLIMSTQGSAFSHNSKAVQ